MVVQDGDIRGLLQVVDPSFRLFSHHLEDLVGVGLVLSYQKLFALSVVPGLKIPIVELEIFEDSLAKRCRGRFCRKYCDQARYSCVGLVSHYFSKVPSKPLALRIARHKELRYSIASAVSFPALVAWTILCSRRSC